MVITRVSYLMVFLLVLYNGYCVTTGEIKPTGAVSDAQQSSEEGKNSAPSSTLAPYPTGSRLPEGIVACTYHNELGDRFPSSHCNYILYIPPDIEEFLAKSEDKQHEESFSKLLAQKKKKRNIKILLVVDSSGGKSIFEKNVASVLQANELDGLVHRVTSFDIEYMKSQEQLTKKLKDDLSKHSLLLLLQISPKHLADYPISQVKSNIDYFIVDSMYTDGSDEKSSPLNPLRSKNNSETTIESIVNYILDQGVPSKKIIIPLAFEGRIHFVAKMSKGTFQEKLSFRRPSKRTAYHEICPLVKKGTVYWDKESETPLLALDSFGGLHGLYSVISYDNRESLEKKVQYGKSVKLGGFFVPSVVDDDSTDVCGEGEYPLLTSVIAEMIPPMPSSEHRPGGIVLCEYSYYTYKLFPLPFSHCTHVVYVNTGIKVFLDENSKEMKDVEDELQPLLTWKKKKPHIKILINVKIDKDLTSENEKILPKKVTGFLLANNVDGIVLNYKQTDKDLAKKLKEELGEHSLTLLIIISDCSKTNYSISEIEGTNVYFMYRSGTNWLPSRTVPKIPLYSKNASIISIESTVRCILDQGAPPSKVIMSVWFRGTLYPLWGRTDGVFGEGAKSESRFLYYKEVCPLVKQGTRYWDRETQTPLLGFESRICYDVGDCAGPYSMITYDDSDSIVKKVQYGKKLRLGGFYIEDLHADDLEGNCGDGKQPLLNALTAEISRPMITGVPGPDPSP